ncbi:MAG: penicillin-binding protein, partial [Candidatus Obscuribacterales bacterium]|nr:penicillin-binding protein [Candidatus Obscuribacterales bacterium]
MAVKSRRRSRAPRSTGNRRRQNKFVSAATWTLVGTAAAGAAALAFITFPVLFSRVEVAGKPIVRIYDRKDQLACTLSGNEERLPIALSKVSPLMQKATIAAEDHLFYEHSGVNFSSIARAAIVDVSSGRALEGGSTITQQLAKNLYSKGIRRSIPQKIREAVLAWQLEKDNSKDKILESYLNEVYFGRGAYGIERAANQYFAKSAQNLNLAESAYLAGIISSPSRLSSPDHYPEARTRQRQVIDSMLSCHFINAEQANKAKASPLKFQNSAAASSHYLYYVDAVTQILNDKMPALENSKQDIDIFTNLDPAAQRQAEVAINKGIVHAPKGVNQGALVSISVKDGAVIALVGGAGDFYKHQWNRAINPHTVGSSFKPFVYLAAILSGTATPHTVLHDDPISIPQDGGP